MTLIQDFHVSSKHNESAPHAALILIEDKVNDLEFFYAYYRLNEEGLRVDVASAEGGIITGQSGNEIRSTLPLSNVRGSDYSLLYIPGGNAPVALAKQPEVIHFVQEFIASGRLIGVICHGPLVLVAADAVQGVRLAAWPAIEKEIEDAGGSFINAPVIEHKQFISARWPGDLPLHLEAILKRLRETGAVITEHCAA